MQGEVDATRLDIAARVDGRVGDIPVVRGQNVAAGAVLVRIDNPETLAKHEQALAAKVVAEAQLANINVGTRPEVIAARKAALERAQASVVLAQKTYDRVSQLAEHGNAPQARLDQATDALHESQRAVDQAKSAYEQAVNGYTREEREIAAANVGKAIADIKAVQSIIDQMVVYAPVASQVYQRNVEPGEYVSPGVPLVTLIDLDDMWIHFDLREDLVKTLKVGDRFDVRIPALGDRRITVEVKLIATKGEYASWRATRATGDFDLRTFSIRAYPVDKVPELRPGMSAYLDWRGAPMRAAPKPGFLLVARREWRWLLHDRVALILIFGVPLFAFVVLTAVFSHPVIRGLGVVVVDADRSETSRAFVEQVAASPSLSIVERAGDLASAARAIRSGDAIAAVYIPANFERDLKAERRPQVVAFYNQQFLTAAGVASSGLSDSLGRRQRGVRGPRGAKSVPHRLARRRDDRAGQSGEELRAVPAARAAADGHPRGHRARRRLRGRLRVPPAQHAHLARLRGRQSDRRARRQARAAVRDFLRHHAVGAADLGGTVRDLRSRATCR